MRKALFQKIEFLDFQARIKRRDVSMTFFTESVKFLIGFSTEKTDLAVAVIFETVLKEIQQYTMTLSKIAVLQGSDEGIRHKTLFFRSFNKNLVSAIRF